MQTTIEWTATTGPNGIIYPGYSFNGWWGCIKVSPACEHCYAETIAERFAPGNWGPAKTTPRKIASKAYWQQPFKWNMKAKQLQTRLKVFCASMSDVFEDHPQLDEPRGRLWPLIEATPALDWLLLTKRPENVLKMIPESWKKGLPGNVWMGTSVENQKYANERIPELLKVPARIRFLSCEPLLGPIEFSDVTNRADYLLQLGKKAMDGLNWIIAGGESGPQATPSHPTWFRSLRDQCQAAGVPFFFKQFGEFRTYTAKENHEAIDSVSMYYEINGWHKVKTGLTAAEIFREAYAVKMGKHAAGNLLDGKKYLEMPV